MDELSQAYLIFQASGFLIDIASPSGGQIEADKFDAKLDFNAEFLSDARAQLKLKQTLRTDAVNPNDYVAVYIAGGKGAMFDLPKDLALHSIVREVYEAGGAIGAVCHGPAALVNVRLSDGSALLSGKRVTGFSNEEEAVFGKKWRKEFPFLLEDAVKATGAQWQEVPLMLSHVISDGRIVTGQNPYSTAGVAESLVRVLGTQRGQAQTLRKPWRDERTMQLLQRALVAPNLDAVENELARNPKYYHIELIGLIGYYQLQSAVKLNNVRTALKLMQLAAPYMDAPELSLAMAKAHQRLGQIATARALVAAVLKTHPNLPEAIALSNSLAARKR